MNPLVSESPQWQSLAPVIGQLCARIAVAAGPAALARELTTVMPHHCFRQVLSRGGWYRLGGVLDADGRRIADDIEYWAETALADHGGDLPALADFCAEQRLQATRLIGKTHYWVAASGPGAADFVQLEIEELQEMICPGMLTTAETPATLEELIDRREAGAAPLQPTGTPFYSLRRITDAADFLGRMRQQKPEPQPVHRFLDAWSGSSAGATTQFANHWILALREYQDRYRQPILQATPVPALNGAAPRFDGHFGQRGLALSEALQRFDRQAGYPMAWFFHMLTTKTVPHAVAAIVVEDMQNGFAYLPERDLRIVKDWLYRAYGF